MKFKEMNKKNPNSGTSKDFVLHILRTSFIRLHIIPQAQFDFFYHGSTRNTTNSSLRKTAQAKVQEPQVTDAAERATSLALVFFSKYAMLNPSFKEKNIIFYSQPDHP